MHHDGHGFHTKRGHGLPETANVSVSAADSLSPGRDYCSIGRTIQTKVFGLGKQTA